MIKKPSFSRLLGLIGVSCAFFALLSSCHLIKRYPGPVAPVPPEWKNQPIAEEDDDAEQKKQGKQDLCNWWEVFEDSILTQLEQEAIFSNYNLWAALERVIESRSLAYESLSRLSPQVNFAPSLSRYGQLLYLPIGNATNPCAPPSNLDSLIGSFPTTFRDFQSNYQLLVNISYELDLWRKLQSQFDASLYRYQATTDDYLNVYLTLTADVAANYFMMRDLDAQIVILNRTIQSRQKAYAINKSRFDQGIITELDVTRAEVQLARAQSDQIDLVRQRQLKENMIATLIGTPASVFSLGANPLTLPPPQIPTLLPSELLQRRPDIASAERNMAAAYAEIEAAYAGFFPSVNLNGSFGLQSPFAHLLFNWKARFYEVGVSALQTIFDAGRTEANYSYFKALFRENYANYEQAVITAFQEVEDALINIREKAKQGEALERAVNAADKTLHLSQERYDHGLVTYLDVSDAETSLLETEQNLALTLGERYTATINLIKALGGSWD